MNPYARIVMVTQFQQLLRFAKRERWEARKQGDFDRETIAGAKIAELNRFLEKYK